MRLAVLGAGPAGATAAATLAGGGAAVTLFQPPRRGEKPCGGAVPSSLTGGVGDALAGLPAVVEPMTELEDAGGGRLEIRVEGLRVFRRGDFDRRLREVAEAVGARWSRRRVEALEPPRRGRGIVVVAGGRGERFDGAVAADGARGLSRRWLGLEPAGESFGLGASLSGVGGSRMVLAFPGLGDAYLWIFPRPGGCSVGIAYTPAALPHATAREALDAFLDRRLGVGWREAPGPRYRYPIPVFGAATLPALRRAAERRVLLVGDAAVLVDPLTREGIRPAVLSGRWAAEAWLSGRPEAYAERVAAELGGEMERSRRLRPLFFGGPLGRWMVLACRLHPGLRRVLADLLACRQGYRGLRRRLLRAALGLDG